MPVYVEWPLDQLSLYEDGFLCQLDPDYCHYVCRVSKSTKMMKKHWQQAHGWSVGSKRGRPSQIKGQRLEDQCQKAMKRVQWQRFFPSRYGSHYFEVRQPGLEQEQAEDDDHSSCNQGWRQLHRELVVQRTAIEDKARTMIQEGEADEVNPWLERVQGHQYLVRLNRIELVTCVEEPESDEEPEAAIWKAMDKLVHYSQQTPSSVEWGVRAWRPSVQRSTRHSISHCSHTWMRRHWVDLVLMFFARTQKKHEWKSLRYRFTRRQHHTWQELTAQAQEDCIRKNEEPEQEQEEEKDASKHDSVENKELGMVAKAC